eukprot:maker-scaffold147_size311475-snap-gene-2.14 protein:Tk08611 transcript:maker-scaffold147_size311475-snap-gene-2.14-mRNA-1 annotation:"PREDICTED: uncharacterized protein LOC101165601"
MPTSWSFVWRQTKTLPDTQSGISGGRLLITQAAHWQYKQSFKAATQLGECNGNSNAITAHLVALVALTLMFGVTIFINSVAGALGAGSGIVHNSVGNLSRKYYTMVTPAGWVFSIWSVIYLWIMSMIIFFWVTVFRSNDFGKVYLNPVVLSKSYMAVFFINLACNTAWIFIWDNELLILSSVFLFLIAVTNIVTLAILSYNIAADNHRLKSEQPGYFWSYIVLSQNCHGTYTAWSVIASFINLITALHYSGGVDLEVCSIISLTLLLIVTVVWFVLENVFLDRFVRFLVVPYIVVIWACAGIVYKQQNDPRVSLGIKSYVFAILGVASLLLVLRIGVIAFRQVKRPFNLIRQSRSNPVKPRSNRSENNDMLTRSLRSNNVENLSDNPTSLSQPLFPDLMRKIQATKAIRRPQYQPGFSRVVRTPEQFPTAISIDQHDRMIVDEPSIQQYDIVYEPEIPASYTHYTHGILPWMFRPRAGQPKVKLLSPKRGVGQGIRLI